jgi:hypothetical protein
VTDNAGNANSATIHYTVQYTILGFFSPAPGSKRKLGQTVAVAVAVGDVNGVRVSGVDGAALASACRVTFSASGAQAITGQCMKYDAKNRQFTFDWVLPKKGTTGADTIAVTVTYPNTTTSTSKAESITIG